MTDYNQYDEGQVITLSMSFKDAAGVLTDPGTVTLELRDPESREITTYTEADMTHDSVGAFHIDVSTTGFVSGTWFYKTYSTGAAQGAKEWAFIIKPTEIPS